MNFNSLQFLIFLPVVLLLYWLLPHRLRWVLLLLASYYFYMSWNAWLVFAILGTTIISYLSAILIERTERRSLKKLFLVLMAIISLGLLVYFKYYNFLIQSAVDFLNLFRMNIESPSLDIILPVGISFYTFQTLSYVIDVYNGSLKAERHFGYYALYVSYFPQLVAGPIERAGDLLPQLKAEHFFSREDFESGFRILLVGFFRKCVVADFCGLFVNNVFANLGEATGIAVFVASGLFCIQMYCDFAGYSEIAMGCARMMGVKLTRNFNRPYLAQSYTEFFRRWHITLNRWFTDYVYIPMGGSKKGKARKLLNILIVFALSGLWHGANWTYLIWGLYAGIWVCAESIFKKPATSFLKARNIDLTKPWIVWARRAAMFLVFMPAALIFRAESVAQIGEALSKISVIDIPQTTEILGLNAEKTLLLVLCIACMCLIYYFGEYTPCARRLVSIAEKRSVAVADGRRIFVCITAVIVTALMWTALLESGDVTAFQYFQF